MIPLPEAVGARPPAQVVDPVVSRSKFDGEIAEFHAQSALHRRRGWWLLDADFPHVSLVLAAPQVRPPAVVCGVELDFTNYDVEPPSVALVDPFSRQPYVFKELPTPLPRRRNTPVELPGGHVFETAEVVTLMQAASPEDVPFLCVPGVREYHRHPAHTGDPWLARRGQGEGTLFAILNTIYQYGVQPIADYGVGLRVVGFRSGEVPP